MKLAQYLVGIVIILISFGLYVNWMVDLVGWSTYGWIILFEIFSNTGIKLGHEVTKI